MMRRFLSGLLVLAAVPALFTVGAASVEEEPMVGVRIVYTLDEIKATPSESYYLRVFDEETRVTLEPAQPLVIKTDGAAITATSGDKELLKGAVLDLTPGSPAGSLTIEKVPYGIGWWWAGVEDRDYEGKIQIRINENKKLDVVVTLPIEEYLRGVVPSEIGGDSPAEALKAQAVAARSETVTALRKRTYAGDHYDMCADVECQVYSGTKKRTEATDAAIKATRGLVLTYKDEPIPAFYASNCGGCSEDAWNVWPSRTGPVPYWSSRFDTAEAPHDRPQDGGRRPPVGYVGAGRVLQSEEPEGPAELEHEELPLEGGNHRGSTDGPGGQEEGHRPGAGDQAGNARPIGATDLGHVRGRKGRAGGRSRAGHSADLGAAAPELVLRGGCRRRHRRTPGEVHDDRGWLGTRRGDVPDGGGLPGSLRAGLPHDPGTLLQGFRGERSVQIAGNGEWGTVKRGMGNGGWGIAVGSASVPSVPSVPSDAAGSVSVRAGPPLGAFGARRRCYLSLVTPGRGEKSGSSLVAWSCARQVNLRDSPGIA